eukprot:scaffold68169_cov47-Prasinocladus_malaysianus.AAC.1
MAARQHCRPGQPAGHRLPRREPGSPLCHFDGSLPNAQGVLSLSTTCNGLCRPDGPPGAAL